MHADLKPEELGMKIMFKGGFMDWQERVQAYIRILGNRGKLYPRSYPTALPLLTSVIVN